MYELGDFNLHQNNRSEKLSHGLITGHWLAFLIIKRISNYFWVFLIAGTGILDDDVGLLFVIILKNDSCKP